MRWIFLKIKKSSLALVRQICAQYLVQRVERCCNYVALCRWSDHELSLKLCNAIWDITGIRHVGQLFPGRLKKVSFLPKKSKYF